MFTLCSVASPHVGNWREAALVASGELFIRERIPLSRFLVVSITILVGISMTQVAWATAHRCRNTGRFPFCRCIRGCTRGLLCGCRSWRVRLARGRRCLRRSSRRSRRRSSCRNRRGSSCRNRGGCRGGMSGRRWSRGRSRSRGRNRGRCRSGRNTWRRSSRSVRLALRSRLLRRL